MSIGGPFDCMPADWPTTDREWARGHVGCNVSNCPNGKCRATGECVDKVVTRNHVTIAERHAAAGPRWVDDAPPLQPMLQVYSPRPVRTIIAFTGLAGSGKSTAAAHLVKHHGFQRVRFAGPLKAMLAALGCTPAEIDGSKKETPCDLLGGKTPRHAMQTLGTEWGRELIAPDLWIRAWQHALSQVPAGVPVVVDDCRFPNEADAVRAAGGVVVGIERPGAGAGAAGHKSEGNALQAVATLHNTAEVRHLFSKIDDVLLQIGHRHTAA